ncbi:hypothetical protein D3C87_1006430 [compost metagenome]
MTRSIRFQPDPLDHALIDFQFETAPFEPEAVGLILNESYAGCALVIKTTKLLNKDQKIKVKVGRIDPMMAKVIWVQPLEASLVKVGIQFLE